MKLRISKKVKKFLIAFSIGAFVTVVLALIAAQIVEDTSGEEFCGSCHEMDVFCETWKDGIHGSTQDGTIAAKCTDCHLPHGNVLSYLTAKAVSGAKDVSSHLFNHQPDWIENLEHRDKFTFESGCKKCHVELVAPDISIKAIMAHRDYSTGETEKTCVECHKDVGHNNLVDRLTEMKISE